VEKEVDGEEGKRKWPGEKGRAGEYQGNSAG